MFQTNHKLSQRLLSALLTLCLLVGMIPTVTVQAAEIKSGDFDPKTGNFELKFGYQRTQYVNINVYVRSPSEPDAEPEYVGSIVKEYPLAGYRELKERFNPCEDDGHSMVDRYDPEPYTDGGLIELTNDGPGKTSVDFAGNPIEPTDVMLHTLVWNGTLDGIPIIGPNLDEDVFYVTLEIEPLGLPDQNKPCVEYVDDEGKTHHTHGDNYTWTRYVDGNGKKIYAVSTEILVDYRDYGATKFDTPPLLMLEDSFSDYIARLLDEQYKPGGILSNIIGAISDKLKELKDITKKPDTKSDDPIDMITGAYQFTYNDMKLEGAIPLTFLRAYNSRYAGGGLGKGFSHSYEYSLRNDRGMMRVTMPGGEEEIFLTLRGGGYDPRCGSNFTFEDRPGGYRMLHRDGAEFDFTHGGQLSEIRNPDGTVVAELSYSGDQLTTIEGVAGSYTLTWENGYIASVTDSAGRTTTYEHNGELLTAVTNPDGDTLRYTYDENGYLATSADFEGEVYVENDYDEFGRVTDQLFRNADVELTATVSYDDDNYITTCTDYNGLVKKYYYNSHRDILKVGTIINGVEVFEANTYTDDYRADSLTDRMDNTSDYELDDNGRVTKITTADGAKTRMTYTADGEIASITDALGHTEHYTYSGHSLTEYQDKNGNATTYTYNALGLPITKTDALGNTTTYAYDAAGRLLSVTDPEGGQTSYDYDDVGRMIASHVKLSDSETATTEYEYSDAGKLLKTIDALGNETSYTYNGNGFTTSVTDALGGVTSTEYGTNGQPLKKTDANGNETVYTYNDRGLLEVATDPEGNETTYTYNDRGLLTKTKDPSGNTTKYEYDELDRLIKTTDALDGETVYEYDVMGRTVSVTDAEGDKTSYAYDKLGRRTKTTDAEGGTTTYTYDPVGNVLKTTDANGNATSTEYDVLNRAIKSIDAEGNETSYEYDKVGRMVRVTDPMGGVTSYTYDLAGNRLSTTDANGNVSRYVYDLLGRTIEQINADNTSVTYAYDALGRTTSTTDALGGVTAYTYDANGNRLTVTDPLGNATSYTYNRNNQVITVTDAEGNVTTYTYVNGLTTATTDAAGNTTRYEYDALNRLAKTIDALNGETSYAYDAVGRTVSVTDANGGKARYAYDKLGRRTKTTDAENNVTEYFYDPVGNLLRTIDANGNATSTEYDKVYHAVKKTDAEGNVTAYEYDKAGRIVKLTNALDGVISYTYDAVGNRLTATDPNGNVSQYTYDVMGRAIKQINADNTSVSYDYDELGHTTSVTDERKGVTAYTYDAGGNRLTVTDPLGHTTTYTYNKNNQTASVTYPDGGVVNYAYSPLGAVSKLTNQNGGVTAYTFDELGRQKTITDAENHVTEYTYDAVGNVVKTTVDGNTVSESEYDKNNRTVTAKDGLGNAAQYAYDGVGNLTAYTDREGNATEYTYNKNYQTVQVKDAMGGTQTTEYDALGRVVETTDENGNSTATTYDPNGNVLTVTDALNGKIAYTYDARNRIVTMTDKRNATTKYLRDEAGNVVQTTDANGGTAESVYDANNNLIHYTNRVNEWMKYDYDTMNRQIKATNQLNHASGYEYDLMGNRVAVEDGNHNKTVYAYDGLNRVVSEKNAEGGELTYTYDYLGNLATVTADGGNGKRGTTTYTYDAAGNRVKETSPLGYVTSYTYDKEGHALTKTDENGKTTSYEYDKLYRLTKRTDGDGSASYAYDAVGNMTSAEDTSGKVGFTYDKLYRTTQVSNEYGTTTAYSYDPNGNRLSITYPDGKAVTTSYDALGNPADITDHDGTKLVYTRDAEGRVIKESHSDGSTTEYDYNAAGLLTLQKEVTKDNTTRRQIAYAYDDAGNLISENRSGVDVDKKDELVRYYYDKAGQLTKTTTEGVTKTYAYDLAGNLLSDGEYTYTYDIQNHLLTKTGAKGATKYEYDAAGNLIKETAPDGTVSYTYNAQNKLIKGEKDTGESSSYTYNALGVRIENVQVRKNENAEHQNADLDSGSKNIPNYLKVFSDLRAIWQRVWESEVGTVAQNDFETVKKNYVVDLLSTANRDIFVTEDGSFTQRYVYDANGKRLSAEFDYADGTERGTTNAKGEYGENPQSDIAVSIGKVWYRTSHLNSTLFAVNKDGEVIAHAIYDPWGNPLTETYTDANFSGLDNLNNYTGYTWDETLELYFAQNRFYDAGEHRFTQEDIVKDGGNWYVYCGNGPTVNIDWYGLCYFDSDGEWYHDDNCTVINPDPSNSVLEYGNSGYAVAAMQSLLVRYGYLPASEIDGSFGPITESAVKSFQHNHGLTVDGLVGPQTWGALLSKNVVKDNGKASNDFAWISIYINGVKYDNMAFVANGTTYISDVYAFSSATLGKLKLEGVNLWSGNPSLEVNNNKLYFEQFECTFGVALRSITDAAGYSDTLSWWMESGNLVITLNTDMKNMPVQVKREGENIYITAYLEFLDEWDTLSEYAYIEDDYMNYAELAAKGIQENWSGSFSANEYDQFGDYDTVFVQTSLYAKQKTDYGLWTQSDVKGQRYLPIYIGTTKSTNFSHIPRTWIGDWSISNRSIFMEMYNHDFRLNKDGTVAHDHDYTYNDYMHTTAHEFGHVLGLGDAYDIGNGDAYYDKGATWNEVPYGGWLSGDMMRDNGYVTPNDIEMMLEAWKTNSWQVFVDNNSGVKSKSVVIRQKQK